MDIIEFLNEAQAPLFPVQELILRLVYGLPSDHVEGELVIRPGWRNRAVTMSASMYVDTLQDEKRAPKAGASGLKLFMVMGKKSGKDTLARYIAAYEALVPKYKSWLDGTVAPIYVVHPTPDLADVAAQEFRTFVDRAFGKHQNWTGRLLLDRRGRPVVCHTTPETNEFKAINAATAEGLVIWNNLTEFEHPLKATDKVNRFMRQIAFSVGDDSGFLVDRTKYVQYPRIQVPTWEARPDMDRAAFLDIWKSMVECHPPHSEERIAAELSFRTKWGAEVVLPEHAQ